MPFCQNCGTKLSVGAKFCSECGTKVGETGVSVSSIQGESETRKQAFAGGILKCPNCGSKVDKLDTVCPECGHKLEGGVSKSVQELAQKLNALENELHVKLEEIRIAREKEKEERKRNSSSQQGLFGLVNKAMNGVSAISSVYGNMFDQEFVVKDIRNKEAAIIVNFSIPTSISEICDLVTFSAGQLFYERYPSWEDRILHDAWIKKLQQSYAKAKLTFSNTPEFSVIEEIYKSKMRELKFRF